MTATRLYFDFISPYAYLAFQQLDALTAKGLVVEPVPVVFAGLLQAHGQLGPAEIPAKRRFVARDCARAAARIGVPITFPARHPFRSIEALRLCLPHIAGEHQRAIIDAIWTAGWGRGLDISDPNVLANALEQLGLDGQTMVAATREMDAKIALTGNTKAAIGRGVFGVPTFEVGGQLIWGHDRMADVLAVAGGTDVFDTTMVAQLDDLPVGATRRREHPALARIEAVLEHAPFVRWLGIGVQRVTDGRLETSLTVRADMLQQDAFVHAGVVTTLADHTAGAAAATVMEPGRTPLSIAFDVHLLSPALGPKLRCVAKVLRTGRRIIVVESEVFGGPAGELCAKATVTLKAAMMPNRL